MTPQGDDRLGDGSLVLRPPGEVMHLSRLGAAHPTRLSFMRCLLRRIAAEGWRLSRPIFDLDDQGYGTAVYRVETPGGVCSLIAFSHELNPEERSDRVIAEKWDATFALGFGKPTDADIERLRANVPKQEAGRCSPKEVVLSRANKSVRLFQHVVDCLAEGRQPSLEDIVGVGYLMRTTAVYGNGKFGMADLARTFGAGIFRRPFEAEMLSVFLTREFTIDLVEHIGQRRGQSRAVSLEPAARRALGIGNSTGLGMAPYLASHPALIHRWVLAREIAVARILALPSAALHRRNAFRHLLDRAIAHVDEWDTADRRQAARITLLRDELRELQRLVRADGNLFAGTFPWRELARHATRTWSEETQELLNSLMLEPHGELVDDLADEMADPEAPAIDPTMTLGTLREMIARHYGWALGIDFSRPESQHFFWYRSEEKEEPRLGVRGAEPGAEREMRLTTARDVQALDRALPSDTVDLGERVGAFLLCEPKWRFTVGRIQLVDHCPYGEVRDNLLSADCVPVDLLRFKLAFFGASKFDPKSDRWTRITMYQGAPSFAELAVGADDDWAFPVIFSDSGGYAGEATRPLQAAGPATDWGPGQQDPGIDDLAEGARSRSGLHSMNEIYRLCQKAVEGCGAPAGADVDTANAVIWLLAHEFPVLDDFSVELEQLASVKPAWSLEVAVGGPGANVDAVGRPGALYAAPLIDLLVAAGADGGGSARLGISNLSSPLFLLAAVRRHLGQGWCFSFNFRDAGPTLRLVVQAVSAHGITFFGPDAGTGFTGTMAGDCWSVDATCVQSPDVLPPLEREGLVLLRDSDMLAAAERRALAGGIEVAPETWRRLWGLAKFVLVPATRASRARGAGAALDDSF